MDSPAPAAVSVPVAPTPTTLPLYRPATTGIRRHHRLPSQWPALDDDVISSSFMTLTPACIHWSQFADTLNVLPACLKSNLVQKLVKQEKNELLKQLFGRDISGHGTFALHFLTSDGSRMLLTVALVLQKARDVPLRSAAHQFAIRAYDGTTMHDYVLDTLSETAIHWMFPALPATAVAVLWLLKTVLVPLTTARREHDTMEPVEPVCTFDIHTSTLTSSTQDTHDSGTALMLLAAYDSFARSVMEHVQVKLEPATKPTAAADTAVRDENAHSSDASINQTVVNQPLAVIADDSVNVHAAINIANDVIEPVLFVQSPAQLACARAVKMLVEGIRRLGWCAADIREYAFLWSEHFQPKHGLRPTHIELDETEWNEPRLDEDAELALLHLCRACIKCAFSEREIELMLRSWGDAGSAGPIGPTDPTDPTQFMSIIEAPTADTLVPIPIPNVSALPTFTTPADLFSEDVRFSQDVARFPDDTMSWIDHRTLQFSNFVATDMGTGGSTVHFTSFVASQIRPHKLSQEKKRHSHDRKHKRDKKKKRRAIDDDIQSFCDSSFDL